MNRFAVTALLLAACSAPTSPATPGNVATPTVEPSPATPKPAELDALSPPQFEESDPAPSEATPEEPDAEPAAETGSSSSDAAIAGLLRAPDGGPVDASAGTRSPSNNKKVVRALVTAAKRCFSSARERNPSVEARVVLRLEIDLQGQVTSARVAPGIESAMGACIANAARRIHFGPGEQATVTYSFVFKLKD